MKRTIVAVLTTCLWLVLLAVALSLQARVAELEAELQGTPILGEARYDEGDILVTFKPRMFLKNSPGSMPAIVPASLRQTTVLDMEPGTEGWAVPWAAGYLPDGTLWLRDLTVYSYPHGTIAMWVTRRPDGAYAIRIPPGEEEIYEMPACTNCVPVALLTE